jgi:hypothetical protein
MTLNFPGPYELRIFYTGGSSPTLTHSQRLNFDFTSAVNPGDNAFSANVVCRDGTPRTLQTVIDNYLGDVLDIVHTTNEVSIIEVWKYPVFGSFEAIFIAADAPAEAGLATGSSTLAGQHTITFRTFGGGVFKWTWLESVKGGAVQDNAPFADTDLNNIRLFFESATHCFVGRDGHFPLVGLRMSPGQNEAVFKKRFR